MSTLDIPLTPDWQRERRWLGIAGLVPFVAATGVLLLGDEPRVQTETTGFLLHYAAVIASFLGAVHWGMASRDDDPGRRARLRWGVVPALLAWLLLALPATPALLGFAALFALILWVDYRLLPALDSGYRRLRALLTTVVSTSLLVAAAAAMARAEPGQGRPQASPSAAPTQAVRPTLRLAEQTPQATTHPLVQRYAT